MKKTQQQTDTPQSQDSPHDKEVRTKEGRLTYAAFARVMKSIKEFKEARAKNNQR